MIPMICNMYGNCCVQAYPVKLVGYLVSMKRRIFLVPVQGELLVPFFALSTWCTPFPPLLFVCVCVCYVLVLSMIIYCSDCIWLFKWSLPLESIALRGFLFSFYLITDFFYAVPWLYYIHYPYDRKLEVFKNW